MAISLNHTIVPADDKQQSAEFLAGILGLEVSPPFGPFVPLRVGDVALDFSDTSMLGTPQVPPHHYAFLVSEPDFDDILGRIRDAGVAFYAEPREPKRPGEINYDRGGRTVYFDDPNGHVMEVLTHAAA
jgi:catechol 2,3-dioxygenase-like lactoylglutathione lyase family enzyme